MRKRGQRRTERKTPSLPPRLGSGSVVSPLRPLLGPLLLLLLLPLLLLSSTPSYSFSSSPSLSASRAVAATALPLSTFPLHSLFVYNATKADRPRHKSISYAIRRTYSTCALIEISICVCMCLREREKHTLFLDYVLGRTFLMHMHMHGSAEQCIQRLLEIENHDYTRGDPSFTSLRFALAVF